MAQRGWFLFLGLSYDLIVSRIKAGPFSVLLWAITSLHDKAFLNNLFPLYAKSSSVAKFSLHSLSFV